MITGPSLKGQDLSPVSYRQVLTRARCCEMCAKYSIGLDLKIFSPWALLVDDVIRLHSHSPFC